MSNLNDADPPAGKVDIKRNAGMNEEQQPLEEDEKFTRRLFVQYSVAIAGSSSTIAGIVLKTDALAAQPLMKVTNGDNGSIYHYVP